MFTDMVSTKANNLKKGYEMKIAIVQLLTSGAIQEVRNVVDREDLWREFSGNENYPENLNSYYFIECGLYSLYFTEV